MKIEKNASQQLETCCETLNYDAVLKLLKEKHADVGKANHNFVNVLIKIALSKKLGNSKLNIRYL